MDMHEDSSSASYQEYSEYPNEYTEGESDEV